MLARTICAWNRRGFLAVRQCLLFLCIPLELNQTPRTGAQAYASGIIDLRMAIFSLI